MTPDMMQMMQMMAAFGQPGAMGGGGFGNAVSPMYFMQLQFQLLACWLKAWLDYFAAMQDMMRQALERLEEMSSHGESMMAGMPWWNADEDDDDEDESDDADADDNEW